VKKEYGRTSLIPSEFSSTRRWRFLEDSELPDCKLKRKRIHPNDDLPMTDSGEWLIRNDVPKQAWRHYTNRNLYGMLIQPPAGWLSTWSQSKGEGSIFYPHLPYWTAMTDIFEKHDILQKLKDAGVSGWVPADKRKERIEQCKKILG
jgi:hypothetical protein